MCVLVLIDHSLLCFFFVVVVCEGMKNHLFFLNDFEFFLLSFFDGHKLHLFKGQKVHLCLNVVCLE